MKRVTPGTQRGFGRRELPPVSAAAAVQRAREQERSEPDPLSPRQSSTPVEPGISTLFELKPEYYPSRRDRDGRTQAVLNEVSHRMEAFIALSPEEQAAQLKLSRFWMNRRFETKTTFGKMHKEVDIDRTEAVLLERGLLPASESGRKEAIRRMTILFGEPPAEEPQSTT